MICIVIVKINITLSYKLIILFYDSDNNVTTPQEEAHP